VGQHLSADQREPIISALTVDLTTFDRPAKIEDRLAALEKQTRLLQQAVLAIRRGTPRVNEGSL
jgi:hypothetical protein